MSDTPDEVRAVLAQLGGPNAEFYSGEAESMLERYADLLERSAGQQQRIEKLEHLYESMNGITHDALTWQHEHMKVCAGTWVPVTERMPEISGWYYCIDDIGDFDERMCGRDIADDGSQEMRFTGHLSRVTHWLDARLPTGGQR